MKKWIAIVPFSVNHINIGLDLVDPSDDTPVDIPVDLTHMLDKLASVARSDRFAGSPIDIHSDNCFDSHCTRVHNLFEADNLVEPPDRLVDRLVGKFDFDWPVDNWPGKQVVLALEIYLCSTLAEILVRSAPHFDNKQADTLVDIVAVAAQFLAHNYHESEMTALGYIDLVTFAVQPMMDYFLHKFDKINFHQSNLETFEALNNWNDKSNWSKYQWIDSKKRFDCNFLNKIVFDSFFSCW